MESKYKQRSAKQEFKFCNSKHHGTSAQHVYKNFDKARRLELRFCMTESQKILKLVIKSVPLFLGSRKVHKDNYKPISIEPGKWLIHIKYRSFITEICNNRVSDTINSHSKEIFVFT